MSHSPIEPLASFKLDPPGDFFHVAVWVYPAGTFHKMRESYQDKYRVYLGDVRAEWTTPCLAPVAVTWTEKVFRNMVNVLPSM